MTKQYLPREFQELLAESANGDAAWCAEAVLKLNVILERSRSGGGVAVYTNQDMSSPECGHRQYVSYGSTAAQLETPEPPEQLPDIGTAVNWRYRLTGTYSVETLDLVETLRRVAAPIGPAVAYISAGFDVNGNSRKGWAVYREQKLIEFVPDNDQNEDRLSELGVTQDMATGVIKIGEETWGEISNEDNWPPSSRKFSNHRAERLYNLMLEGFSDGQIGDSDWGSFSLFSIHEAILQVDSQGFVTASVFDSEEELTADWERLSGEWNDYNEEEE